MNYINFERKYVSNGIAGSIDTICLWKHQNGSVCEIEQYMTPNYVYMRFENGTSRFQSQWKVPTSKSLWMMIFVNAI